MHITGFLLLYIYFKLLDGSHANVILRSCPRLGQCQKPLIMLPCRVTVACVSIITTRRLLLSGSPCMKILVSYQFFWGRNLIIFVLSLTEYLCICNQGGAQRLLSSTLKRNVISFTIQKCSGTLRTLDLICLIKDTTWFRNAGLASSGNSLNRQRPHAPQVSTLIVVAIKQHTCSTAIEEYF